jgi:hypothetical protein
MALVGPVSKLLEGSLVLLICRCLACRSFILWLSGALRFDVLGESFISNRCNLISGLGHAYNDTAAVGISEIS